MATRVAVIYGGRSGEHDVSLRSAEAVIRALDPSRYDVRRMFIDKAGRWDPAPLVPEPGANPGIDVVFPVLHGTFGEDGTMQGLLELADLPYVGAGVLGSAACMDKELAKRACRERGIEVVESVTLRRGALDVAPVEQGLGYPVFVKPANMGSSVGISRAADRRELEAALALAAAYDRKIVVERAIVGRELECSVLGNDEPIASVPCEILPSRAFYDYEDKYLLDTAKFELPAKLPAETTERLRRIAVDAYRALECFGMARVDFFLEGTTGRLYVNELNTIPGFTSISMYPKMWEYSGLPFPALVERLLVLALERHAEKKATRFER
ncbi:MAG: D-alanine--D-alanine ligase [Deltaproteobacteria bacterium]|nr:D-alanine--D-alanine ligase [Deltaproteobacteria bacterium]